MKQGHIRRRTTPRGYESVDAVMLTEARIDMIRRLLQSILEVVDLEVDGEPVKIDGFRLRDISRWADYPSSLSDIFWHLSSVCNFSCEFCYEKGNPQDFPIQNTPRMASVSEIDTRLRYYDPDKKTGIFSVRTSINEPFVNKNAMQYLRKMRAKCPDELISFVTNGSFLTEDNIKTLKELEPVFFNLSLYSVDKRIRQRVLWDLKSDVARGSPELLARHRVPYMANLVMWPSISMEDMERTIAHADDHSCALIRICLGGYTRYLQGDFERFDIDDYWPQVVNAVELIRSKYRTPIIIEPNSYVHFSTDAYLDGVIVGSPADLAGLKRRDLIKCVNGVSISSRLQLLSVLRKLSQAQSGGYRPPGVSGRTGRVRRANDCTVNLQVQRGDDLFDIDLQRYAPEAMLSYPYSNIAQYNDFLFGLILTDTLSFSALALARKMIRQYDARKTLILSSPMIEPILHEMIRLTGAFEAERVDIRVAYNRFFGGTINVGDLLVVEDFVDAINDYCKEAGSPDLVLIPASPFASSAWNRDLNGTPWTYIERRTGIRVAMVDCNSITF
ncbi:MAG: radical SAM protein [Planctomycetota bacterium]